MAVARLPSPTLRGTAGAGGRAPCHNSTSAALLSRLRRPDATASDVAGVRSGSSVGGSSSMPPPPPGWRHDDSEVSGAAGAPPPLEGLVDDVQLANPLKRLERLGTGWLGAIFE